MSEHVLELAGVSLGQDHHGRRHHLPPEDQLVLTEVQPDRVIDAFVTSDVPLDLSSFGAVREACPKCQQPQLKLILRQSSVRAAHLFCTSCESCFDAHYPDGTPALTI
jgi:hypothetical protein